MKWWKRKIGSHKTASFLVFSQLLENMEDVCFDDVQLVMKKHLVSLIQEFDLIIPKKAKEFDWVANWVAFDVDTLPESCQTIYGFQAGP